MSDFSYLLQQSIALTQACITDLQARTLPPHYAQQTAGQLRLKAHFYRLNKCGEMRSVLIQAPKIDIINIFFFPATHCDLPVYAMEFVSLGQKPVVAVIDALSLIPQTHSAEKINSVLLKAHQDFAHLQQAEEMPDWYQACRSGLDFFVRPQNSQDFQLLGNVHLQIWQSLMAMLQNAQPMPSAQQAAYAQALKSYKKHHCDNSPGLKLLQQKFGNLWTQAFLQDYLFS